MKILGMLICQMIVIWVIDDTDLLPTIKKWLGRWLGVKVGSLKPFDCSLCSSFHVGWIYMIIAHLNWKWIGLVAFVSAESKVVAPILRLIRYAIETATRAIEKRLDNYWKLKIYDDYTDD